MEMSPELIAEVAELAARYGEPRRIVAQVPDGWFSPITKNDRFGEVCMVIRRPGGGLLVFRKTFYPAGVLRLLTGGVAHGERVEAALLREIAEETSLQVAVRRFLALIGYNSPDAPGNQHSFFTFAFLLDELGGELACADPEEQVELFSDVAPADLPGLADRLAQLDDRYHPEIEGSWRSWGIFRAAAHRAVAEALAE